jgi:hypothetical protein
MRSSVLGALIPVGLAALLGSTALFAAGNACNADLNGDRSSKTGGFYVRAVRGGL